MHTPGHTYDHLCILVDNNKLLTGDAMFIGDERANNGALKAKTKDEFFKYMAEDWPHKPPDYQNIIRLNRGEAAIATV